MTDIYEMFMDTFHLFEAKRPQFFCFSALTFTALLGFKINSSCSAWFKSTGCHQLMKQGCVWDINPSDGGTDSLVFGYITD